MKPVLVAISNLHKAYTAPQEYSAGWLKPKANQIHAINGLDLTIYAGETLCVVGESAVSYTHLTLPTTPYV